MLVLSGDPAQSDLQPQRLARHGFSPAPGHQKVSAVSIESMNWALRQPLSGTKKVVLIGIASHADADGDNAWPSISTLTEYASVSERAVQQAISELQQAGYLTREFNEGGGKRLPDHLRPNLYKLQIAANPVPDTRRSRLHPVKNSAPPGADDCTTSDEADCTPPGEADSTQLVLDELSFELSVNHPVATRPEARPGPAAKQDSKTTAVWRAYSSAYASRYGSEPLRNASVNGKLASLLTRIPADDAPHVAAFFVRHNNSFYVQKMHAVGLLLQDAEGLYTQWKTNRTMTATKAAQVDKTQTNLGVFAGLRDELCGGASNGF